MKNSDLLKDIEELENQIKMLPQGYIAKKKIGGQVYHYHRYKEFDKIREKYIDYTLVDDFISKIELRKRLVKKIKDLKKEYIPEYITSDGYEFNTYIRTGINLKNFVVSVSEYKKRNCYSDITNYLYNNVYNKVLILYGLRRTGKTTLIKQAIYNMSDEDLSKAAYIQVTHKNTLAELNQDLRKLEDLRYKYIFIDEVTLLADFIEGAALFSDIYAASGMKIVLTGTDSLGFIFTKSEELYDRCILVHTTYIPYHEFESVLGVKGIDEYIRYGGTMSVSGVQYNDELIFENINSVNEYIDTSIAKNIQHSLKYYQDGCHFRHLRELFEKQELTSVINRVIEDINHRFTKDVLIKEFKSNDLGISLRNFSSDKNLKHKVLEGIEENEFTKNLKKILSIIDVSEQTIDIEEIHALEIKEYLELLDLIKEIDILTIPRSDKIYKKVIITQPGIRYAQAKAFIESLLKDSIFLELTFIETYYITNRIVNEIKGRMMEDIVLLETKNKNLNKKVFKLEFSVGEFDMVIFDPNTASCEIYEIKYSKEIVSNQYKHLIDIEKRNQTELNFGPIKNKTVIYRGITKQVDDINYINVEEYLNSL